MTKVAIRQSTSVGIIEARNQPEYDTELLLEDSVDMNQVMRSLTGLPMSQIERGLELGDEWD